MGTRLIALDLDGTLLNEKMHVSEKTRQVMELCAQRGIEIVPATGRALPAVPEEVLSLPGVHYGIFTNGAVVPGFREKYLGVGKLPELGRDDPGD